MALPEHTRQPAPNSEKSSGKKKKFESNNKYFSICTYVVATFTICLIIFKFINNWRDMQTYTSSILSTLSPFLIAFLIAYFINPLVNRIDHILFSRTTSQKFAKLHKFLSLLLAYVIVIGFIALVLTFVIPQIVESILELIRQSSSLYDTIMTNLNLLNERYPNIDFAYIIDTINNALPNAINSVQAVMTDIVPMIYNAGMSIISWIINIILAFVISCYLMSSKHRIIHGMKRIIYALFDQKTAYKVIFTIKECNHIFGQYIIGKALDSLIIGIICFVLMCILHLQYALLISIIVGITNMIPYFGPFIGAIPSIFIIMIADPIKSLIFAVFVLILQQLDGNIIGPKILGDSTGLSAFWVIFAVTFFGGMFGFIGMLIGVPTFAVIYALIRNIAEYLLGKKGMVTQTPDFASQENPIFQKVKYHESSKAPHSVVEVCDLDGQQPETEEQRNAYKLQKSREEE